MPTDVESLVGRTLAGRFRVVRLVGRGGMGAVLEAVQLDLDRKVALKVLLEEEPRAIARFRQEATALAKLRSPNIVTITDFVVPADAPPMLVMELLDGEPLSRLLYREKKLAPERAVGIAVQVLAALADAHAHGIVHRDIKPSNIFLVKSRAGADVVKVLDFGVAKVLEGGVKTTTGAIVGTPAYLAPEQILGRWPVGPATDLHAVGIVLYEMIAGERPWDTKDSAAAIAYEPPRRLAGAPPAVADAVTHALAKEPAKRFPSAEAMIDALGTTAPRQAVPLPAPDAPRGARPFAIAFALTGAVAAAAIGLVARSMRSAPPPPTPPPPPTASASAAPREADASAPDDASTDDASTDDASTDAAPRGPVLGRNCYCIIERTGGLKMALCQPPLVPTCTCEALDTRNTMCPHPFDWAADNWGDCKPHAEFAAPGKKTGDPCTGYLRNRTEQTSVRTEGTLYCTLCQTARPVSAVEGTACSGYDDFGDRKIAGRWKCGYR